MEEEKLTSDYLVNLAIKRIKLKRSLYSHIGSYVFVNAFLVFMYYITHDFNLNIEDKPWYLMVIGGWGLGLAFDIFDTIQSLKYKYNVHTEEKELNKLKNRLGGK